MGRQQGDHRNGQQSGSRRTDKSNGDKSRRPQFQGRGKNQFCNGHEGAGNRKKTR